MCHELIIPNYRAYADTNTYADNTAGNTGADMAFRGEVTASNGSFVEFDWLFDAVNVGAQNLAPTVNDQIINALVGTSVSTTVIGSDPNSDPLTWSLSSSFGPIAPIFDPSNQLLTWDTTGLSVGDTLIANIRASDGSLTDTGTITVNMISGAAPPNAVPVPATILLMGAGLLGMTMTRRRNKK